VFNLSKEDFLVENSRQIAKAEAKINDKIDIKYWINELDILQNERMLIEAEQWQ